MKIRIPLYVAKYPTGLEGKVKDVENIVSLLRQSGKPQVLGMVGLCGVGKSTLAKELFNRHRSGYRRSSFLSDVRSTSLLDLQRKLLTSLTGSDMLIDNIDEGINMLKAHLPSSQALIILDDVDDLNQVDALLPIKNFVDIDGVILITSRNKNIYTPLVNLHAKRP